MSIAIIAIHINFQTVVMYPGQLMSLPCHFEENKETIGILSNLKISQKNATFRSWQSKLWLAQTSSNQFLSVVVHDKWE